jgi:hypothetical protein
VYDVGIIKKLAQGLENNRAARQAELSSLKAENDKKFRGQAQAEIKRKEDAKKKR